MRKLPLTQQDLSNERIFLIAMFHYDIEGEKKRFCLPRLITGDKTLEAIERLSKNHNAFKYKLYHSNFPHTQQLFEEICTAHQEWSARLLAFEKRIPYLKCSTISKTELEEKFYV